MKDNESRLLTRRMLLFEAGLSVGGLVASAAGVEMMKVSDPKMRDMSFKEAVQYLYSEDNKSSEVKQLELETEKQTTVFDKSYVKYPMYLTGAFLTVSGAMSVASAVFNAVMLGFEKMGADTTSSNTGVGGPTI